MGLRPPWLDVHGLFSLRERLEATGGSFEIVSAPSCGTRATIRMRLIEARLEESKTDTPLPVAPVLTVGAARRHGCTGVLIVDDHPVVRDGLRTIIDADDAIQVVGESASGEEALRMTQQLRPDVVVMDVNLPQMGGIEATRQIKHQFPSTVVIGLSVRTDAQIAPSMKAAGAVAFLTKSSAADKLCRAIRGAVNHRG